MHITEQGAYEWDRVCGEASYDSRITFCFRCEADCALCEVGPAIKVAAACAGAENIWYPLDNALDANGHRIMYE